MIKDAPGMEAVLLNEEDFELECESRKHTEIGTADVVALVAFAFPCCGRRVEAYLCRGCLDYVTEERDIWGRDRGVPASCGGSWFPYNDFVKKVHYL